MNININSIKQSEHRFCTIGDWEEDENGLHIWITEMDNQKYWFAVLFHELIEICLCKILGVTSKMADDFDELWERVVHCVNTMNLVG